MAEWSRPFGPFVVSWLPQGGAQPHVVVRIAVVGQLLWERDLQVSSAPADFEVNLNTYRATGTIGASWLDPDGASGFLYGQNVVFTAPDQEMTFAGTLGVWTVSGSAPSRA